MLKVIIIIAFVLIRFYLSSNKKKQQTATPTPQPKAKPATTSNPIEDLLKEWADKPKVEKQFTNIDTHKASDDEKRLDWQEVVNSKIKEKESLLQKTSRTSSSSTMKVEKVQREIEPTTTSKKKRTLQKVNLKQAVLYKTILERKYFSV